MYQVSFDGASIFCSTRLPVHGIFPTLCSVGWAVLECSIIVDSCAPLHPLRSRIVITERGKKKRNVQSMNFYRCLARLVYVASWVRRGQDIHHNIRFDPVLGFDTSLNSFLLVFVWKWKKMATDLWNWRHFKFKTKEILSDPTFFSSSRRVGPYRNHPTRSGLVPMTIVELRYRKT